jgi:hypothetical protein
MDAARIPEYVIPLFIGIPLEARVYAVFRRVFSDPFSFKKFLTFGKDLPDQAWSRLAEKRRLPKQMRMKKNLTNNSG